MPPRSRGLQLPPGVQTLRQAKRAYARSTKLHTLSEREIQQIERSRLDRERAARCREREEKRRQNAAKKAKKERELIEERLRKGLPPRSPGRLENGQGTLGRFFCGRQENRAEQDTKIATDRKELSPAEEDDPAVVQPKSSPTSKVRPNPGHGRFEDPKRVPLGALTENRGSARSPTSTRKRKHVDEDDIEAGSATRIPPSRARVLTSKRDSEVVGDPKQVAPPKGNHLPSTPEKKVVKSPQPVFLPQHEDIPSLEHDFLFSTQAFVSPSTCMMLEKQILAGLVQGTIGAKTPPGSPTRGRPLSSSQGRTFRETIQQRPAKQQITLNEVQSVPVKNVSHFPPPAPRFHPQPKPALAASKTSSCHPPSSAFQDGWFGGLPSNTAVVRELMEDSEEADEESEEADNAVVTDRHEGLGPLPSRPERRSAVTLPERPPAEPSPLSPRSEDIAWGRNRSSSPFIVVGLQAPPLPDLSDSDTDEALPAPTTAFVPDGPEALINDENDDDYEGEDWGEGEDVDERNSRGDEEHGSVVSLQERRTECGSSELQELWNEDSTAEWYLEHAMLEEEDYSYL